jgi:hypothetical protein
VLLHSDEPRARQELAIARRLGADTVFTDNLECLLNHRAGWDEAGLARWRTLNETRRDDPLWMWPDYFMEAMSSGGSSAALADTVRGHVDAGKLDAGVGLFFLASAGPLPDAFALAAQAVTERRLFIVDPWLDETRRFRESPEFGALRQRVGLGAVAV